MSVMTIAKITECVIIPDDVRRLRFEIEAAERNLAECASDDFDDFGIVWFAKLLVILRAKLALVERTDRAARVSG